MYIHVMCMTCIRKCTRNVRHYMYVHNMYTYSYIYTTSCTQHVQLYIKKWRRMLNRLIQGFNYVMLDPKPPPSPALAFPLLDVSLETLLLASIPWVDVIIRALVGVLAGLGLEDGLLRHLLAPLPLHLRWPPRPRFQGNNINAGVYNFP